MEKRGTYRWLSLLLALVFVLGLAGCAPEGSSSSEPESESSSQENEFPENVLEVRNQYALYGTLYGFDYYIEKDLYKQGRASYKMQLDALEKNPGEYRDVTLSWQRSDDFEGGVSRSWSILFDSRENWSTIRDVLTATFMITEPGLSLEDAQAKMEELVAMYPPDGLYTDVIESGDYRILMDSHFQPNVSVRYVPEFWTTEFDGAEHYEPVEYDKAVNYTVYKGTNYVVKGTVQQFERTSYSGFALVRLLGDDGHTYDFRYSYPFTPEDFAVGERLRMYGPLYEKEVEEGIPTLWLDRAERIEAQ